MVLLYFPLILAVLLYSLYYYSTRTLNYWKNRNVACIKPLPLVGNLKESVLRRKNVGVIFQECYNAFPEEKVVGFYAMTSPSLLIRDLEIIKLIMIKDFDAFVNRSFEFSKKGLAENLFHLDGDQWKVLRSKLTPIFTSGKLKNMFHLMQTCGDQFVSHLNEQCVTGSEHEVHNLVQKFTIANVSACAFGLDIDTYNDSMETLIEVDKLVLTPSYINELEFLFPGLLKTLNLDFLSAKVNNFFYGLVKNIKSARSGKPATRNDFMDLLLELNREGTIQNRKIGSKDVSVEITDNMIAAQAFIFFLGGYETSATTMAYAIHELAINPKVQEKLIAEIDESLKANDGKITYEGLKEMKYLDKVINETLRKHSILDPLQRRAKVDYHIPGTDVVIKKGQFVFVSARGVHYDEKLYPNPEQFDPERFSPEMVGKRHPCAFLPFGVGPRNCIGMRFGQVQSRLGIAKFFSKFRVEPSKNTKRVLEVEPNRGIIGPKGGVYLNIIPRQ